MLLTPNFSNPLGYRMADARKGELEALLEAAGVPLIEDDIYADLNYQGNRPRAVKAWDRSGNVLLCSSLSKTLDPGLRIGWAMPGRLPMPGSRLSQLLAEDGQSLSHGLKGIMDRVSSDHVPVRIQRRQGGSAVIMSEEDYAGLQETLYLLGNPVNAARLLEAKARGEGEAVSIEEARKLLGR